MSMARPIDPTCGEESSVEQTLKWLIGASSARSASNTVGRLASIQSGPAARAVLAIPMPRRPSKRASCDGVGRSKNGADGNPAKVRTSITAAEPVKSSPYRATRGPAEGWRLRSLGSSQLPCGSRAVQRSHVWVHPRPAAIVLPACSRSARRSACRQFTHGTTSKHPLDEQVMLIIPDTYHTSL